MPHVTMQRHLLAFWILGFFSASWWHPLARGIPYLPERLCFVWGSSGPGHPLALHWLPHPPGRLSFAWGSSLSGHPRLPERLCFVSGSLGPGHPQLPQPLEPLCFGWVLRGRLFLGFINLLNGFASFGVLRGRLLHSFLILLNGFASVGVLRSRLFLSFINLLNGFASGASSASSTS